MRLIDADALEFDTYSLETDSDISFEIVDKYDIEQAPTINAIIIPENATNGDMLKAIFPELEAKEKHVISLNLIQGESIRFTGMALQEWWNAPYKREEEKPCQMQ